MTTMTSGLWRRRRRSSSSSVRSTSRSSSRDRNKSPSRAAAQLQSNHYFSLSWRGSSRGALEWLRLTWRNQRNGLGSGLRLRRDFMTCPVRKRIRSTALTTSRTARFFETAIVNFAILRNYVAHHSCLDYEIISSDWALDPIEAMLLVLLTALEVFDSDE